MEIKYFKKLSTLKKIGTRPIKGLPISEISKVEKQNNIKFPRAYIEFLYLAGDYPGGIRLLENPNLAFVSDPEILEQIQEQMDLDNMVIERPFWVFTTADGVETFWFFYLDENEDDPKVYGYSEYGFSVRILPVDQKKHYTFSELVNDQLELAILTQKRGY